MIADGTLEYVYTAGILISFLGLIIGALLNRKHIGKVLHESGFKRTDLILAFVAVAIFIAVVIILDQTDATPVLRRCDLPGDGPRPPPQRSGLDVQFGTPTQCFSGQIFHEPIGLSFNIAIGFLLLGVHRASAYAVQIALGSPFGVHDLHGRIPAPQGQAHGILRRACAGACSQ